VCGGSSACTNLQTDVKNCGTCGTACATGESCVAGGCTCGFATVATGRLQVCGVKTGGTVVCAGGLDNSDYVSQYPDGGTAEGGTGNNNTSLGNFIPSVVAGLSDVKYIDGGDSYHCALKNDGTVWCEGSNTNGRLGDGSGAPSASPVQVRAAGGPLVGVKQLSVGRDHACVLKTDGTIWCWGQGRSGELGTGTVDSFIAISATLPAGLTNVQKVVAGSSHTCALGGDKTVWCFGSNSRGQCGNAAGCATGAQVTGVANATDVATDDSHTCAVIADGTVQCWGANCAYQSGGATRANALGVATIVKADATTNLTSVAEVSTGSATTCVRKTDNTVWCWGVNRHGQIGNGTQDPAQTTNVISDAPNCNLTRGAPLQYPTQVLTGPGQPLLAKAIGTDHAHSCALVGNSNHIYCWGSNLKGQSGVTLGRALYATPIFSCAN
jgi:alpha-tubulin suppressor-like RCC1 family protein